MIFIICFFDVLETSLDAFHPIPCLSAEMAHASWGVTKPEFVGTFDIHRSQAAKPTSH